MKKFPRIFLVLMALILVISTVPAAKAAGTAPGKKVSVSFTVKNICGIDGTFSFSNPAIISGDVSYSHKTNMVGSVQNNLAMYYSYDYTDITITVSFKISANAKTGDKCDVIFTYQTSDIESKMTPGSAKKTVVVEIPAPKPTEPASTVDYGLLKTQIDAAKELKAEDYTATTWDALQAALQKAEGALKSKDQKVVDAAAAALADAIKNLKKLDYTALAAAIEKTEAFLNSDVMEGKGGVLLDALLAAKALLNNAKDQQSIDNVAAALLTALTALDEVLKQLGNTPVVVEPTDDYCNISIHYVWPILFFVCLTLNLAFVALVAYYLHRRRKENDDTPLVNYDIEDDI